MRIYLIGYMYCGKTTVGGALARRLGFGFHDIDQAVEARYRTTVPIFFKNYGEALFRHVEREMLHATAEMDNCVVSTGGGTPCFNDNMEWINAHGVSVRLNLGVEATLKRMELSRKRRPLLAEMDDEARRQSVRNQMEEREQWYAQAQVEVNIDGKTPEQIADEIMAAIDAPQLS